MVRWLMAANPDDRPSAQEVLRSELLPPTEGDEQLTDLLRSLPDKCVSLLCAVIKDPVLCRTCIAYKLCCCLNVYTDLTVSQRCIL